MGKSQKKRAMRRHNPIRVPDEHLPHGLEAAQSAAPAEKAAAVLPIIQKLNSSDAADRAWACAAISNVIQNDPGTRRLLQGKNVVGNLITRLSDNVDEVAVEASGALRNLCIDGGYDICGEMYNKNVLAPLRTCITKMSVTLNGILSDTPASPAEVMSRKLVYEFAENVITIFWCLSETSNKALNAINQVDLTPFLMSFIIARTKITIGTVVAAAQCLYVLTDDNPPYIDSVRSSGSWVNTLIDAARPSVANGVNGTHINGDAMHQDPPRDEAEKLLSLKVLSCGILRNISPLPSLLPAAAIDIDQAIALPLIVPLLELSLPEIAVRAMELERRIEYKPFSAKAPKSDHRSDEELELDSLERRVRTLQLGLEILTGVCAVLPDDDRLDEPFPEPNGMEEEDEDEDMDMMEDEAVIDTPPVPLPPVLRTLISLPSLLLSLLPATQLSYSSPSPVPPITSALRAVHLRAMEALSNLFLGAAAFGVPVGVRADVWRVVLDIVQTADNVTEGGGMPGEEIRSAGIGVLWACLEAVPTEDGAGGEAMEAGVDELISLCDLSKDEASKVKFIGILSRLGQRREAKRLPDSTAIAAYLFRPFTPPFMSLSAPLTLAYMHAVIDMFSDETSPCDVVFGQNGCLALMEGARPWLSKEIRKWSRRERDEGREMVREWGRFCEWRRSLR